MIWILGLVPVWLSLQLKFNSFEIDYEVGRLVRVLLFIIKLLDKFVQPDKSPGPAYSCAAVDQDGLSGVADGPDCLHHVQHDLGVLGGGEVSPLLGLKMSDPANLPSVFHQFEGPANHLNY